MTTTNIKYLRVNDIIRIYSIKRTSLYHLIKSKQIESKLLSPKIRIISVKSIDEYINSK